MHSWRLRSCLKWITLTLLMAIIARFKANQCVKRVYRPVYVGESCMTVLIYPFLMKIVEKSS